MKTNYRGFRDLKVYQLAYKLALEIFEISKGFPKEEIYSLTDQIRRSSRSVPTNIAESWYRRKYPNDFVFKLTIAAGEAGETQVWLDFSFDHGYISKEIHDNLIAGYNEVGRMLTSMINKPEQFCYK